MTSHDVIAMSRFSGCLWRKRPQIHLLWSRFLSKTTKAIYYRILRCADFTFQADFTKAYLSANFSVKIEIFHRTYFISDIHIYPYLNSTSVLCRREKLELPKNLFWLNVQSSGHDLYVHAYIVIMYCKRFLSVIYSLSFLHSSSIQVVWRIDH